MKAIMSTFELSVVYHTSQWQFNCWELTILTLVFDLKEMGKGWIPKVFLYGGGILFCGKLL